MTDDEERLQAVRTVRQEADNLRMACVEAAKTSALLHVAYDQDLMVPLPLDQAVLVGTLRGIQ